MRTDTWYVRRGTRARRGGLLAISLAAVLLLAAAAPAGGQETCDESAGTLGIQAMRCEGCTFTMSRQGIEQARFRTEPQVLAVARGFTRGDRLRAGDRIVAVDGELITTRAGGDRLVELRNGQELRLRVRRDGRIEEIRIVAGSACELRRQTDEREVEIEVVDEGRLPRGYVGVLPPVAKAPMPPLGAMPVMPAMPVIPPSGYLGFGIKCGPCGMRDGVRFFDENPPVVTNVVEGGPADEAGLEPEDVILAIDGLDITTDEGGGRFSEIEPGDRVELTVRRGDARRTITLEVGERVARPAAPASVPAPPAPAAVARWRVLDDDVRFEGNTLRIQDVTIRLEGRIYSLDVEVRGAPVMVTRDEATGELVIRTQDNVIRLKRAGG